VELSDHQARKLGAILAGRSSSRRWSRRSRRCSTTCSSIGWPSSRTRLALTSPSPGADKSIAELEIRRSTGVTIIAIIRGDQAITAPEPLEIMRVGDRLVVVSRHQDLGSFRDLVVG
jgi:TrkA domain protein